MGKVIRIAHSFTIWLMLLVLPASAMAWEFQMSGFTGYVQSNYFQNGPDGFFGPVRR